MIVALIVLALILVLGILVVIGFNRLRTADVASQEALGGIDVELTRRADLIPNLVETVKGYMAHERETLDAVIQARSNATSARESAAANPGDPQSMGALMAAEEGLGGALGKLFALSEGYPDLKANQNVSSLMEELKTTENKIAFARQHYNDSVMTYNNKREMFPSSIIAGMFNFSEASMFEIGAAEREEVGNPVKVEF